MAKIAPLRASVKFAKVLSRSNTGHVASRGYRKSSRIMAAQNFTMPAMSPTMTEGNIANWKVQAGDSFSTGDVLLEIETDKAQMDVEAQDDGKMARIIAVNGAKGVKVGSRIAILAEIDDDLSTLSLPAEASPQPDGQSTAQESSPQETLKSGIDRNNSSESQAEAPPTSKASADPSTATPKTSSKPDSSKSSKPQKQSYPLYPSIAQLLHERGVPLSQADMIPASGPKGRLLKGDVLAYLGRISKSYPAEQSARITKLGHLDLSNIQAAPPSETSAKSLNREPTTPSLQSQPEPSETEVAVPISLSAVISAQKRIQDSLGVTLPLSTFLARATELANDNLPRSTAAPTADELFNDVLGLGNVNSSTSAGTFVPQITALPSQPMTSKPVKPQRVAEDIYDILAETSTNGSRKSTQNLPPPPGIMGGSRARDSTNMFSVRAPKGEEKRARVFLERVKTILQVEPGRLVL